MNPFLHYRERLWSYQAARASGWSDARFVEQVNALDTAVAEVDGHGFKSTPFVSADALGDALGLARGRLWIKDDTENVGGSHKARHLFGVALQHAVDGDSDGELAIASCGNAALAAAVVARAARRPIAVFIPTWADPNVVRRLEALEARIVVCERRAGEAGDPAYLRFAEAVADGAVAFSCQSTMTPATLDGGRTIGWELADQMREHSLTGTVRVYVQVGGGALATSLWLGLSEGLAENDRSIAPSLYPVQTCACAPLARAWALLRNTATDRREWPAHARAQPERFMWAWEPVGTSAAMGIVDDVTYDWTMIVTAMAERGGEPVVVAEPEVLRAHALIHAHTPIDADATGSSGLAGVVHDAARGRISDDDTVVVLATGVTRR